MNFKPLTAARWKDFEKLFGERGACGGCWCMTWRLPRSEFVRNKGEGNRKKMHGLVKAGNKPGIIAYINDEPFGWCSVAPREEFSVLGRSRILAPVDDKKVWSITCLFIKKEYRKKGLSGIILKEAAQFAFKKGAKIVEGYPYEITNNLPDPFVWTGLLPAYKKAGFKEVLRRSKTRPIVRKVKG
jgi:GNAT superfamily N-acetyltransferase